MLSDGSYAVNPDFATPYDWNPRLVRDIRFIDAFPDKIDQVEWVLFDDRTYAAYEAEIDGLYKEQ